MLVSFTVFERKQNQVEKWDIQDVTVLDFFKHEILI